MFLTKKTKTLALLMSLFWFVSPCGDAWASKHDHGAYVSRKVNHRKMSRQNILIQQKSEGRRTQEVIPDFSRTGLSIKPQYVVPVLFVMSVAGYYMLTSDQDLKDVMPSHSDLRQFAPEPVIPSSLNVHAPIPLLGRTSLYRDLEDRYCQGELCDEHGGFCNTVMDAKAKKMMRSQCAQLENAYKKYDSLEGKTLLLEDKSVVKIVPQGAYYTGISGQIVTGNLQKCVGVAVYNPETGMGGVAHFAAENLQEVDSFLQGRAKTRTGLQTFLSEIMKETDPSVLKVTLVSGDKAHIEYAARFMKYFGIEDVTRMHKSSWGAPNGNNYFSPNYVCGSVV